jgi:predicted transcriptional regulator
MTQEDIKKLMENGKKRTTSEVGKMMNIHESTAYAQMRKLYMRGELEREWDKKRESYVYFKNEKKDRKEDLKRGLI